MTTDLVEHDCTPQVVQASGHQQQQAVLPSWEDDAAAPDRGTSDDATADNDTARQVADDSFVADFMHRASLTWGEACHQLLFSHCSAWKERKCHGVHVWDPPWTAAAAVWMAHATFRGGYEMQSISTGSKPAAVCLHVWACVTQGVQDP